MANSSTTMIRLLCLLTLAAALFLGSAVHAGAPGAGEKVEDLYFCGYILNHEAVRLESAGDLPLAAAKFNQANAIMEDIARRYPAWQPEMRALRQRKIGASLVRVQAGLAASSAERK